MTRILPALAALALLLGLAGMQARDTGSMTSRHHQQASRAGDDGVPPSMQLASRAGDNGAPPAARGMTEESNE